MDESLWSTRNVAEYAYCPRLFYLMEVEGVYLPSDDTELGNRIHRHVDQSSSANVVGEASETDAPKVVRSLTLTSVTLGLTATLDLAKINGKSAVPLEYRKGRPHHLIASDNDRTSSSKFD
jgi:CRISPR-associated protein Cas1